MIIITHARIIRRDTPPYGVTLNIRVPADRLGEARAYLKEYYNATSINLTYHEPVR